VGHVALLPLVLPYKVAWIEHREHHAHANDPEMDPDYGFHGRNIWASLWNAMQSRQPWAQSEILKKVFERTNSPDAERAVMEGLLLRSGYYAILTVLAWSGFAIEAFFLWWLPRHLGYSYITTCLGWAPHFPYQEQGRYRDTRAWKSPIGTVLSLGMEYHQVHHLFPRIPLLQTGPAYWELRDLLERHGARDDRPDAPPDGRSVVQ
jgi:beta-carotene hydroxylase